MQDHRCAFAKVKIDGMPAGLDTRAIWVGDGILLDQLPSPSSCAGRASGRRSLIIQSINDPNSSRFAAWLCASRRLVMALPSSFSYGRKSRIPSDVVELSRALGGLPRAVDAKITLDQAASAPCTLTSPPSSCRTWTEAGNAVTFQASTALESTKIHTSKNRLHTKWLPRQQPRHPRKRNPLPLPSALNPTPRPRNRFLPPSNHRPGARRRSQCLRKYGHKQMHARTVHRRLPPKQQTRLRRQLQRLLHKREA